LICCQWILDRFSFFLGDAPTAGALSDALKLALKQAYPLIAQARIES
jgi:hypothetical protein